MMKGCLYRHEGFYQSDGERSATFRDSPLFNLAAEMEDVISLGVGEPDFLTPWNIREEAIYTLEKGRTIYTANAGLMELRREISRYLQRKYHLEYDPATQILVTVGAARPLIWRFAPSWSRG